ncbi:flagellar basal body-associated FliL family protein [Tissierella carlieri]|uniref:Flagellar protein FliL n=1 Tax=Tissierella carlieri TaxID=689904 RepID=A0ABT1S5Q2_9FIRM|nr:flagellar basal body-associated FliL family protein [Tissierella carlieri]MBU5314235.1 flagellar basal body-associated FliL family protein [Tissierella carlieri]MCQ4921785.1 flagellar basal body-associated FliL family protein [Tissierella carlieri]
MSKNTILIVIIVLLLSLIAGIAVGIFFFSNNSGEKKVKKVETYSITLEDLYCNIKDSKRILKIKITLETINEDTLTTLTEKQFLIRDDVNKIITNLTEEELRGKEGQINLQNQIKTNMVELFNDESIINVYFNDFIIQ